MTNTKVSGVCILHFRLFFISFVEYFSVYIHFSYNRYQCSYLNLNYSYIFIMFD